MASIKKFRDKWYARIQTWDNGVRREKLIPLKTESKVEARVRIAQIEKVEKDIKDGVEFDFPWIRNNGGKTKVKPLILSDAIDKFINHRIKSDSLRASTISINRRALNLFMDIGTVFDNQVVPEYSKESVRASYGFGLKFYSVIGPIGLTWGYPLLAEDHDIERMFSFNIGLLN